MRIPTMTRLHCAECGGDELNLSILLPPMAGAVWIEESSSGTVTNRLT